MSKKILSALVFFFCVFFVAFVRAQDIAKSCRVGVYIMSLYDLKPAENTYSADFWVWYNCPQDKEIKILESRELVNSKHAEVSLSDSENTDGNMVWSSEKIKAVLLHDWDITNFPFDTQNFKIVFEEGLMTHEELLYAPDQLNSKIDPNVKIPGWKMKEFKVESFAQAYDTNFGDPTTQQTSSYSRFVATITMQRDSVGLFLKLHMGVYIAFIVGMFAFLMDSSSGDMFTGRISLLVGMLFAALLNLQIVDSSLGSSVNMTLVDRVHILTLFYLFLGIPLAFFSRWLSQKKTKSLSTTIDKTFFFISLISYVLLNLLMVHKSQI